MRKGLAVVLVLAVIGAGTGLATATGGGSHPPKNHGWNAAQLQYKKQKLCELLKWLIKYYGHKKSGWTASQLGMTNSELGKLGIKTDRYGKVVTISFCK